MIAHNLTLPLYPHQPVGNVWAWDAPFELERVLTRRENGVEQYVMSFHSETGTRLMLDACYFEDSTPIHLLDYSDFVDRPTLVVDIPKEADGVIEARDIDKALREHPRLRQGDAVLIRTGWSDGQRHLALGDDYARHTPHFSVEGSKALVAIMREIGSKLFLTDCAYVGNLGERYMYREWGSKPAWERPPFPSPQAKAYMREYTTARGAGGGAPDWAASVPLHEALCPVAALANCDAITAERIRVTVLPLFLQGAAGAPCTVFASEEEGDGRVR